MSKPSTLLALLAATALAPQPAAAQDASVKARLDQAKIRYEIDKDGDFRITYNYKKEGRTQLVFVSGKTQAVGDWTIREIFSPAATMSQDGIDGNRALALLEASGKIKLGSWEIRGNVLYLVIKVPDTISAVQLESAMDIAASTADDKEIEISGDRDTY